MVKNAVGKAADIRKQQAAYVKELDANIARYVPCGESATGLQRDVYAMPLMEYVVHQY